MIISTLSRNVSSVRRITDVRQFTINHNPPVLNYNPPVLKKSNSVSNVTATLSSNDKSTVYPKQANVVIIGGGFIGSAVAYWLKKRDEDLSVVVIEKDVTYEKAQRSVSLGMLNQHFTLPENVRLAQFSADFLRNIKTHLGHSVDIQYVPTGSLILASDKDVDILEEHINVLNEHGVKNNILTKTEINKRFPWINANDVKLGSITYEAGTFNSWGLLNAFIQKSKELETIYINAKVIGFDVDQQNLVIEGVAPGTFEKVNKVIYKTKDDATRSIKFAACVIAAGVNSGQVARLAQIGTGGGLLNIPLPIDQRIHQIYTVKERAGVSTGLYTPVVSDTTGLWIMRKTLDDDNNLFCGSVSEKAMKYDCKDMSDIDYFNNVIKPSLFNRLPICKSAKIMKFTTEMHDCNTFDNTGVIGPHPHHNNVYIASGFGKLGCQHAPGIGRAVAELVIDNQYKSVDLSRFGFDRFLLNERLVESNVN